MFVKFKRKDKNFQESVENHFRMKKEKKLNYVHVDHNAIDGIKQKWWMKDAKVFLDWT